MHYLRSTHDGTCDPVSVHLLSRVHVNVTPEAEPGWHPVLGEGQEAGQLGWPGQRAGHREHRVEGLVSRDRVTFRLVECVLTLILSLLRQYQLAAHQRSSKQWTKENIKTASCHVQPKCVFLGLKMSSSPSYWRLADEGSKFHVTRAVFVSWTSTSNKTWDQPRKWPPSTQFHLFLADSM